jgi:hypothetical protein
MDVQTNENHAATMPAKGIKMVTDLLKTISVIRHKIDQETSPTEETTVDTHNKMAALHLVGKAVATGYSVVKAIRTNFDPDLATFRRQAKRSLPKRKALLPLALVFSFILVMLRRRRTVRVPRFLTRH